MAITLLSDFGNIDTYVGIMKGVMLGINPKASFVDLTHMIPPQDVRSASFVLSTAYSFFPKGTVHLAIVDPGVGTDRRAIAVYANGHIFVGPDNGLFSFIINANITPAPVVVDCNKDEFYLDNISSTFHGRDVFSPLAAHISKGVPPHELGSIVVDPVVFPPAKSLLRLEKGVFEGEVVHIDCFGNIITSFSKKDYLAMKNAFRSSRLVIGIGYYKVEKFVTTFQASEEGVLSSLVGSSGLCEIFINKGNAASRVNAKIGTPISVHVKR